VGGAVGVVMGGEMDAVVVGGLVGLSVVTTIGGWLGIVKETGHLSVLSNPGTTGQGGVAVKKKCDLKIRNDYFNFIAIYSSISFPPCYYLHSCIEYFISKCLLQILLCILFTELISSL